MPSFSLPPRDNDPLEDLPSSQPQPSAGGSPTFQIKPAPPQSQGGGGYDGPKKDFPSIPDGEMVNVEVVEVELRDRPEWAIRSADDETKEVSFRFRVTEGAYAKRNLWGTTMPYFDYSPKCRLRIWIQAILGLDEIPEGFELRTEEILDANKGVNKIVFPQLAGKNCQILVGNRRNKTTGKIRDFAQDVFPTRQAPVYNEEPF